jgi:hypothetical protein
MSPQHAIITLMLRLRPTSENFAGAAAVQDPGALLGVQAARRRARAEHGLSSPIPRAAR